jgi:RNA polymerase sigma factor (sigma-70 family)
MLGSREEAEDALQHTFLAAFRQLAGGTRPLDVRPWLFAIARNRCVSLLRARRAHVPLEHAEPAVDGLLVTVERREEVRELLADLGRLPEDQRAALLLAELGALDHAGIAAVLGCPREKVKALVFQARSSLAASREARATPCAQIRVELATASGGALRRGPLRRHLRTCDGCRTYKAEVSAQRGLLALALPVIPGAALKASVLGGLGGAHGGAVSTGTAGGTLGGALASSASKVAVSLALAGALAGGGALAVRHGAPAPPRPAAIASRAWPAAAVRGRLGNAVRVHRRRAISDTRSLVAPVPRATRAPQPAVTGPASPVAAPRAPASQAPAAGGGSGGGSTDPAAGATPPTQPVPSTGSTQTPPGAVPPGQSSPAPGHSGDAPGHGGTPPGQGGTPPGRSGESPGVGEGGSSPGGSGEAPGHGGTPPGQSQAHGHAG